MITSLNIQNIKRLYRINQGVARQIIQMSLALQMVVFISCGRTTKPDTEDEPELNVKTEHPKMVLLQESVHCVGMVFQDTESKLSFKTGGIIREVYVDEGNFVQKNQLLATLDLSEINSKVNQASLAMEKTRRDFERVKILYEDTVATLEQLQDSKTALELAENELKIARFNQEYSTIKAPSNGKILKQLHEENEMVAAGYPIFLFGSTESSRIIRTSVTDKDVVKIHTGDSAHVFFDAYPKKIFIARVHEIASIADPYTGVFEIELKLEDTPLNLISGMIARVDIYLRDQRKFFQVPLEAMLGVQNNTGYIYEIQGDTLIKHRITLDIIKDGMIFTQTHIDTSAIIITEGVNYVTPSSKFQIVN